MKKKKIVPNFVIIRSAKCGTTSLHNYMSLHKEIYMSPRKEPGLFLDYNQKNSKCFGLDNNTIKNRQIMRHSRDNNIHSFEEGDFLKLMLKNYSGEKIIGESTSDYTKFPMRGSDIVKNMKNMNPNLKILYIIRNPMESIISLYKHQLKHHREDTSEDINKELRKKEYILMRSYYYQLQHYIKYFPSNHIKIIIFEEFIKNPQKNS